eukprot:12368540-Heterocapsa_arctica.AAC.1
MSSTCEGAFHILQYGRCRGWMEGKRGSNVPTEGTGVSAPQKSASAESSWRPAKDRVSPVRNAVFERGHGAHAFKAWAATTRP